MSADLIDDSGLLQFGRQHRNEDINTIAADDPSYLRWMLDNVEQVDRRRPRSNQDRATIR